MGGESSGVPLDSVEVFDGASWSTLETSLTTPRLDLGLASYGDLLYAAGGSASNSTNGSFTSFKSVEVFNGTSWSAGPDLPGTRYALGLAVYSFSG